MHNVTLCGAENNGNDVYVVPGANNRRGMKELRCAGKDGLDVEMSRPVVLPATYWPPSSHASVMIALTHASSGVVSAVNHAGVVLWQSLTEAAWAAWAQVWQSTI